MLRRISLHPAIGYYWSALVTRHYANNEEQNQSSYQSWLIRIFESHKTTWLSQVPIDYIYYFYNTYYNIHISSLIKVLKQMLS